MSRHRTTVWAFALIMLFSAPTVLAQAERAGSPAADQKGSVAREDLRHAKMQVSKAKGLRGEPRLEALQRGIDAYRQVLSRHPEDKPSCARAWFEIGELLRRKLDLAEAEEAYEQAAALDESRFGTRSLLQQAHLQRRLDRPEEALASYRRLAKLDRNTGRGHTARRWIARCLEERGELTAAIATYRSALDITDNPRRVIELCNGLAKALLAQGDMDAAADVLARADRVVPSDDGEEAVRLRKAVDRMSGKKALRRAQDRANKAHEDARKLEQEKGRRER